MKRKNSTNRVGNCSFLDRMVNNLKLTFEVYFNGAFVYAIFILKKHMFRWSNRNHSGLDLRQYFGVYRIYNERKKKSIQKRFFFFFLSVTGGDKTTEVHARDIAFDPSLKPSHWKLSHFELNSLQFGNPGSACDTQCNDKSNNAFHGDWSTANNAKSIKIFFHAQTTKRKNEIQFKFFNRLLRTMQ